MDAMAISGAPSNVYDEPGADRTEFREAMARLPTAVSIVTTRDGKGRDHGFTAGSVVSVSLQPPLILMCLARAADCHPAFAAASWFAVSVARSEHTGLVRRFATKGIDKFAEGRFRRTGCGVLALEDARLVLECRMRARHPGGDHDILLGEVVRTRVGDGAALVFMDHAFGTIA